MKTNGDTPSLDVVTLTAAASILAKRDPVLADVLPIGDLGLVKGISEVCGRDFASKQEIIDRAERWRPWRSVATRMIWQVYLINRGKDAHAIASG